jgi:hypothetical protein
MVGMVAAVAILVIFSDLAFQKWIDVLRRDQEAEMMFRAQDLVRAIQRYRRDHGGAPPMKLEDLMQPGPRNQYYVRQLWKDPLVKDGKWGLLYAGPGGEIVDPNALAQEDPFAPQGGSGFGKPFGSPSPQGGGAFGNPSTNPDTPAGLQPGGAPGFPQAQPGGATPFGISGGGEDKNAGGKQLAGLPIAGVRTLCKDNPFRVYNGQTEYSKWLFSYLDLERTQIPGGVRAGQGQPGQGGIGQPPPGTGGIGQPPGGGTLGQPGNKFKPFGSGSGSTFKPFGKAKPPPKRSGS